MRWQVLAALTNGWLWLLAVLAGVVLVIASAPVWFALASAATVLLGGATVQGAVEWRAMRRQRLVGVDRMPIESARAVTDPDARAIIARAETAAERAHRIRGEDPDAPADILASAQVASDGAVASLHELGRQVDRIGAALGTIRVHDVQAELAAVERNLARDPDASAELTEQRRAIANGLRSQLEVHRRLAEQRTLVLTRMRSAAIGLEGMAVRLGEIGALYSATGQHTSTDRDLRAVATEMDDLRQGLVEAERTLRDSLRSLE